MISVSYVFVASKVLICHPLILAPTAFILVTIRKSVDYVFLGAEEK